MRQEIERFEVIAVIGEDAISKTLLVKDHTQDGRRLVLILPLSDAAEGKLIKDVFEDAVQQAGFTESMQSGRRKYLGFDRYEGRLVMIYDDEE